MSATGSRRRSAWLETLGGAVANGELRRLQLASLSWSTAEAAYLVGLLIVAYQLGGTPAVAALAIVRTLPSVVLAPVLTATLDRTPPGTQLVPARELAMVDPRTRAGGGARTVEVTL